MDSPIFGHNRNKLNKQTNLHKNHQQQNQSDSSSNHNLSQWYISNKINNNSNQISSQLKLAYTVLILSNNIKTLTNKLNKFINKNKYHAFVSIKQIQPNVNNNKQSIPLSHARQNRKYTKNISAISTNNPQTYSSPFIQQICINKTQQKLQIIDKIFHNLNIKQLANSFTKILLHINYQIQQENSSVNIISHTHLQQQLGVSSKLQSKRHLNSKKHAKQMKQNSFHNKSNNQFNNYQSNSQFNNYQSNNQLHNNKSIYEYEVENEKLALEINADEYNLQRFSSKMNNLLRQHETILMINTERQIRISDNNNKNNNQNVISHGSLENNHNNINNNHINMINNCIKTQLYTKKK